MLNRKKAVHEIKRHNSRRHEVTDTNNILHKDTVSIILGVNYFSDFFNQHLIYFKSSHDRIVITHPPN